MSITLYELLIHAALFLAVVFFVYTLFSEGEEIVADLSGRKTKDQSLADLYIDLPVQSFFHIRLTIAAVLFLLCYSLLGLIAAVVIAGIGYLIPLLILKRMKRKRVRRIEAQLVEGLELLGNGLKSGLTMQQAVELLVQEFPPPISQEFSRLLGETRLGVDFADGLERMAQRLDSGVLHILASGVSIAKQCGGDITQIFANIAATIREQSSIEGKLEAVTAQGRFQGLILGMMPFALMMVLYFVDRSHIEVLFSYRLGLLAVCAVITMVTLAQLWIRKLLAIDF